MYALIVGIVLVLVVAAVFYLARRSTVPKQSSVVRKPETAEPHRKGSDRRSRNERRETIRFEPEKEPRRGGHGKRKEDELWREDGD
ncbi:MAG: hypothetical protein ACRES4_05620 [Nevskiales bacterium]